MSTSPSPSPSGLAPADQEDLNTLAADALDDFKADCKCPKKGRAAQIFLAFLATKAFATDLAQAAENPENLPEIANRFVESGTPGAAVLAGKAQSVEVVLASSEHLAAAMDLGYDHKPWSAAHDGGRD